MKTNHQLLTTSTTILFFLVAANPAHSQQTYHINDDICNTTGSIANDFHITLSSPNPIDVMRVQSYPIGQVFPDIDIMGNGTGEVTINFSGIDVIPNSNCDPTNINATPLSGFHPLIDFTGEDVGITQYN